MGWNKELNLLPKEKKLEVLRRTFGEQYDLMKQYESFQRCNEDEFMRSKIELGVCPVCGKQILESEPVALHHKDYNWHCIYKQRNCERCYKTHPTDCMECMSRLVYLHSKCHSSIHGYDRKENDDEE